ncbi:50S ribosomal protein L32 [bacterium]|nr:50S ribosomal protein L32 [bacterium]
MVPKKRDSKSKVGRRRSQKNAKKIAVQICPSCGGVTIPHRSCPQCNTYRAAKMPKEMSEKPKEKKSTPTPSEKPKKVVQSKTGSKSKEPSQ